jgi:HAD superfamily hydrolase (TIGR01549 family)
VANFDAVLFDWMFTLAHYPTREEHQAQALRRLGRKVNPDEIAETVARIEAACELPEVQEAAAAEDSSPEAHAYSEHLVYRRAGIDDELADSLYRLLGTPAFHRPYPDAKGVLETLKTAGYAIGVVSDIHTDLREHAKAFGFAESIDAWSLSWEQGIQKPNLQIFQTAIDQLGCDPVRTIMVGDRGAADGAAAALGVTCLILPAVDGSIPLSDRRLSLVLDLVGLS